MARKRSYVIPPTTRLPMTFDSATIKELRKIGIDLEMSDAEVVGLAVQVLIKCYHQVPHSAIQERGRDVFNSFAFAEDR